MIHSNYVTREDNKRYSTSTLDFDSVCCFFDIKLMQLAPRTRQSLLVDLRVRGKPAQSVSKKPMRWRDGLDELPKPKSGVPIKEDSFNTFPI